MIRLNAILKEMIKDNEFEKIISNTKGKDKRECKKYYKSLLRLNEVGLLDMIPQIILINECNSPSVWKDIYYYRNNMEEKEKWPK